jgi:hypothetical protein
MKSKIALVLLVIATQAQAERTITFDNSHQGYNDCQSLERDLKDRTASDSHRILNYNTYHRISHSQAQWAHFDCVGYLVNRVKDSNVTMTAHLLTEQEMSDKMEQQRQDQFRRQREQEQRNRERLARYGL